MQVNDVIHPEWTVQRSPYPRTATVHQLFAEQVLARPEAIAVCDNTEQLSYATLDRQSNHLAEFLRGRGIGEEDAVAVVMRRSTGLVVATLGVLKTGGTYVPIDEHCPPERLGWILRDTRAQVVLTDEANRRRLGDIDLPIYEVDAAKCEFTAANYVNQIGGPLTRAYIMYTSGSTGIPKGVEVLHRGIVRLVRNTNYVEFGPSDVVAQVANPAFDAITFEVWGALLNGARLVILDSDTVLSPRLFAQALQKHGVTIMFLTASLFGVMAATTPGAFAGMRTLVVGGDAVNPDAARKVLATAPPGRLVNGYGPTECTTFSVCHWIQSVPEDARSVPIGRPIANSEAYILDDKLQMVAPGEAGDLYLGGDGLARGYLNRPDLNVERFVSHPFATESGARLYKTGDRARYLKDGAIEFLGRLDHQVKFHGFRIELGEIETSLKKHPLIIDAVVKLLREPPSDDRLVGYVSTADPTELPEAAVRQFLKEQLPIYMVPSHVVVLQQLPLNGVGKVDRGALPDPRLLLAQAPEISGATGLQKRILEIWKETLSLSSVGLDDNFFDLGGTSLTLSLVEHKLQSVTTKPFTITDLFRFSTIRTLAGFFGETGNGHENALVQSAQERARQQRQAFRSKAPFRTARGPETNV